MKTERRLAVSCVCMLLLLTVSLLSEMPKRAAEESERSPGCSALYLELTEDIDWLRAEKSNTAYGTAHYISASGEKDETFAGIRLHGHGNSTWNEDKKSWTLSFSSPAGLLDTPTVRKYILISNVGDSSYLRNKITYDLAREIDPAWSPDCEYTEVFVNGSYEGLYLLTEKIDTDNGTLFPQDTEDAFIAEMQIDWDEKEKGVQFPVKYADETPAEDAEELIAAVDRALRADDKTDPVSGKAWDELIDLDSFARLYLLDELSGNVDTNVSSTYFYCKGNGDTTLYAGPIWDLDRAYGTHKGDPEGYIALQRHSNANSDEPWFRLLYDIPAFRERVCALYRGEYLPAFEALRDGGVAAQKREITEAIARDQEKWSYCFDNFRSKYHVSEITDAQALQEWIGGRIEFLNRCWIDGEDLYESVVLYDEYVAKRTLNATADAADTAAVPPGTYLSVRDLGLLRWLSWHSETLTALTFAAAIGFVFLLLLRRDRRVNRCGKGAK